MPLTHRGFSVLISCEGKEIPQYTVRYPDEATVTCYIPSEAGKTFKVHVDDIICSSDKMYRVYADGRYLAGTASRAGMVSSLSEVRTSSTTVRPFQFSQVDITSEESASATSFAQLHLGAIEVRVVHARRSRSAPTQHPANDAYTEIGSIAETSKMVGLNRVSLGPEVSSTAQTTAVFNPVQRWDAPLAVFRFYHRPEAFLRAQGILNEPNLVHDTALDQEPESVFPHLLPISSAVISVPESPVVSMAADPVPDDEPEIIEITPPLPQRSKLALKSVLKPSKLRFLNNRVPAPRTKAERYCVKWADVKPTKQRLFPQPRPQTKQTKLTGFLDVKPVRPGTVLKPQVRNGPNMSSEHIRLPETVKSEVDDPKQRKASMEKARFKPTSVVASSVMQQSLNTVVCPLYACFGVAR
ncbi:hypothetical protein OF83DRAFT_1146782 [Amylostereum chailletii]|nr:hypothetical protein OF83DRAFT_1146782 [Amylostereum chailletii]